MRLHTFRPALAARFFSATSAGAETKLTKEMIHQLLRFPTKSPLSPQRAVATADVPAKKPESIFDLNKSRLEDIYGFYLQTQDIGEVNRRFGTSIRAFRHGLPLPNMDPGFKSLAELKEELEPTPPTPVENLYRELGLTGDSSFEDYEAALGARFGFFSLLGGAEENAPAELRVYERQRELAVPLAKLRNEAHMQQVRKTFELNFNMPGAVELTDPNRFVEGLRPVEDFRHTPVIPIAPVELAKFEERKRKRREEPFHIVYTREKFATVAIFLFTGLVIYLLFRFAMEKEESMFLEYKRTKLKRLEKSIKNAERDN